MTTERNAQGVDGLAEVMGLLSEMSPGPLECGNGAKNEPATFIYCDDSLGSAVANCAFSHTVAVSREQERRNALGFAAAVNYLRSHGEAMQAREKAAQVLVSFAEGRIHHRNLGDCPDEIEGHESRDPKCEVCAALAKFTEPRL